MNSLDAHPVQVEADAVHAYSDIMPIKIAMINLDIGSYFLQLLNCSNYHWRFAASVVSIIKIGYDRFTDALSAISPLTLGYTCDGVLESNNVLASGCAPLHILGKSTSNLQ
jgi:hypothetical protein